MKVANYLAWAAMIVAANKLNVEVPCLDISEKILESGNAPEVMFSKELEISAIVANQRVVAAGLMNEANKIGEDLLIKYM